MTVTKRDGTQVTFNKSKISSAIMKAFHEVGTEESVAERVSSEIASEVESMAQDFTVEEIQDEVEKRLMNRRRYKVARAYMNYRYLHSIAREQYGVLMDAVSEKLSASNVVNQNANVDEQSFGGRLGEASSVVVKKFALERCVSKMARENHERNEIYIHDLDSYAVGSHNCLSVPFDDLLANGFNTRQTDVRPAQSVSTAFQLVAVIFQIQSLQQFGGVSATHLDWTMVPYVRKSFWKHYRDGMRYCENIGEEDSEIFTMKDSDKDRSINDDGWHYYFPKAYDYAMDMTTRECYQAVEGMYHNLFIWATRQ